MAKQDTLLMIDSGYDYYQPQMLQASTEGHHLREFSTINALQANTPFEFVVMGAEGDGMFMDLANSYFLIKARIQKAAGGNPADTDEVSYAQNLSHSMFQRIEHYLNDKLMNDPNGLYPYTAYFLDLLNSTPNLEKYRYPLQGWDERDKPGTEMQNLKTTGSSANNTLKNRQARMGKGETRPMIFVPHLELFRLNKYIPPGNKFRIKFTPVQTNFVVKRGAGTTELKLEIQDVKFYCEFVEATHVQSLSVMESLLKVGEIRFDINRLKTKHLSIPSGSTQVSVDNIYLGAIPNRITMAMVRDSYMAGTATSNPFDFTNFGANQIALYVNGRMIPDPPYSPDWNSDYLREYYGTLNALNRTRGREHLNIELSEFQSGYTIFVWDLTPDRNCQASLAQQGQGSVRLVLRFATALTNTINIILLSEEDGHFEIDKYHNISANF